MQAFLAILVVWLSAAGLLGTLSAWEVAATAHDGLRVTAADIGGGRALVIWEHEGAGETGVYLVERAPSFAGGTVEVAGRQFLIDVCGEGEFSYRVRRSDEAQAASGAWATVVVASTGGVEEDGPGILRGVQIGEDGWAELRPAAGALVVYVSSSEGRDENDGLSRDRPKRSIRAGYGLLRNGEPDWLLLKRGDVWEEGELWWEKSGRSAAERMVVASYGDEREGWARPKWLTGMKSGITGDPKRAGRSFQNLVFRDLHLVQHENEGESGGAGFNLLNGWRDVLIENCRIERYRVNILLQAYIDGVRMKGIAIRRCIIVDALATNKAHAQGIFAEGVDGLLMEENVLDRNGWGPEVPTANMFRHNAYIQTRVGDDQGCTNVVTRGNISARASATGFMQRPGGVVEGNLLLQNPIGVQFGYRGGPPAQGIVRGNLVMDGRDINATEPRAFGLWLTNVDGVDVVENVVAHQRTGMHNAAAINVDGVYRDVEVRGNIVHDWANADGRGGGAALAWHGTPSGPIVVRENRFCQVKAGGLVWHAAAGRGHFLYEGNRYHSARSSRDEFWTGMTHAQWVAASGEAGSEFAPVRHVDADRTMARYMEYAGLSLSGGGGESGGIDEFLRAAREQSRATWREALTAGAVIRYVREGFAIAEP